MLQFGANLMKFDQQIKYLARGAVRAGNYSLNFQLGPGNKHTHFCTLLCVSYIRLY